MVCCQDFEKVGAETRHLGPEKFFSSSFFCILCVIFTQPDMFVHIMVFFLWAFHLFWGQYISCGMSMGHISVFALFAFCSFGRF